MDPFTAAQQQTLSRNPAGRGRIHRSAWLVDSSQYLSETSPHFHALARSSMTITPWRDVFRLLPQNRAPSGQSNYSFATQQRWRVRVVSIQGFVSILAPLKVFVPPLTTWIKESHLTARFRVARMTLSFS